MSLIQKGTEVYQDSPLISQDYETAMARTILTDKLWAQLQNTMKQHGCYITPNTHTIMEAIIWKLRTSSPWRDIPEELVSWKTAYNRFNRWSENGLWEKFFWDCPR